MPGGQPWRSRSGETGRRTGLKIPRAFSPCRFDSDLRHQFIKALIPSRQIHYFSIGTGNLTGPFSLSLNIIILPVA